MFLIPSNAGQWLVGVIPCMPGFVAAVDTSVTVSDGATELYYMSYVYGLLSSGLVYTALHKFFPASALDAFVRDSPSARDLQQFHLGKWDVTLAETPNVVDLRSGAVGKTDDADTGIKQDM